MASRARTSSVGVPTSGGSSGEVVVDLRTEPVVDLRLVDTSSEQALRRGGLLGAAWWQQTTKRWIDVFGSLMLMILLFPVFMATAVAIKLSSRGPVLYTQERIGRDGEPFQMFKFRSMKVEAHEGRDEVLHLNEAGGPVFKIRDDPRITGVGRVIRKLSID